MKKLLYPTLLFALVAFSSIITTSCQKDDSDKPQWPLAQYSSHTLIFYFIGNTLDYAFENNIRATQNALCELSRKGQALSTNAIKPRILYFHHKDGNREKGEIVELIYGGGQCVEKSLATFSMPLIVTPEDMTSYLNRMIEIAPAESYGLIIGSHGCGWIPVDAPGLNEASVSTRRLQVADNSGKSSAGNPEGFLGEGHHPNFNIPEGISNMFDTDELAAILSNTGVKFEYTIYDACLMANIEALYDLRHTSKYIVASVCEIMDEGFPYQEIIPHLLSSNGKSFDLDGVCQSFNSYYAEEWKKSGSISLIDCSQMEALASITKNIFAQTSANLPDIDEDNSQKASLQYYDGNKIFGDFGQYIRQLCNDENQLEAFNTQLNRTVVSKYTLDLFFSGIGWRGNYKIDPAVYSGLSTSQPSSKYCEYHPQTAWYKATH